MDLNIFNPKVLPSRTETGKLVAFQFVKRTDWRLFGSTESPNSFRWDKLSEDQVSMEKKQEIHEEIRQYASRHGLSLKGPNSVNIAMLAEGNLWVSYSGGISSNPLQVVVF